MSALLIDNASVYTGGAGGARAEALAVWTDRLLEVGSRTDAAAAAGTGAHRIDLGGRFVTPGLIDCHVHLGWLALALSDRTIECDGAGDLAEVLRRVKAAAAQTAPGAWLRGRGWDRNQWSEQRFPTAADLDAVTGGTPTVLASHDAHSLWANSAALRLAGIDTETPDPPGGRLLRGRDGIPTGVLQEAATGLVWQAVPAPSAAELAAALEVALPRLNALGLTGLHNCEGADSRAAAESLRQSGQLSLRLTHYLQQGELEALEALRLSSGFGDEWVRLGGLKVFVDGALGGQTAAMLEPYEGSDDAGLLTMPAEEFGTLAVRTTRAGLALAVHAIGDRAVRMVLDGFERVHAEQGAGWPRHRIEHAQHVHPDDQPRFGRLNLIASVQPAHMLADIATAERYLGVRAERAFPLRSLLAGGASLVLGSDAPVETVDPLAGLRAAALRQDREGRPAEGWYPSQRLTVEEALRGYTSAAAASSGEEGLKGTLERGKLADFVVWSHDLLRVPPQEWEGVRALATVVGGRVVYDPEGVLGGAAPEE